MMPYSPGLVSDSPTLCEYTYGCRGRAQTDRARGGVPDASSDASGRDPASGREL